MSSRNFRELLDARWERGNFLCVGLDTDLEKIPDAARGDDVRETMVQFNRAIVDATHDLVCAFKLNSAFYEARGDEGWRALRESIRYILDTASDVAIILDAKRADIGNTNERYAEAIFDYLKVDAVTVHPYLGHEVLEPMLSREEKGIIVLCRTSNPGAKEFQDLDTGGEPLYKVVARHVAGEWNTRSNCALVVGATYPDEIAAVRAIAPDMPFLIPGIGAQEGDLERTVAAGKDARGGGMIIAASRSVIFASNGADYAAAARKSAQELDSAIRKSL